MAGVVTLFEMAGGVTLFENISEEMLHSMSLFSAVRSSLDINFGRTESPGQQLSPRTKMMSKLARTRKLCSSKKSHVFYRRGLDPESS